MIRATKLPNSTSPALRSACSKPTRFEFSTKADVITNALVAGASFQLPDILTMSVHTRVVKASNGGRSQSFSLKTNRQRTPVVQPINVLAKRETKLGHAIRKSGSETTMNETIAQTGFLSPIPCNETHSINVPKNTSVAYRRPSTRRNKDNRKSDRILKELAARTTI